MAFTATAAIGGAGEKHARFFPTYEDQPWIESDFWVESDPWTGPSLLTQVSFIGLDGKKNSLGETAFLGLSGAGLGGIKKACSPVLFAHVAELVAGGVYSDAVYGAAIFTGSVSFSALGAKNAFGGDEISHATVIEARGFATILDPSGPAFFAHSHILGFSGRKIFSYAQIKEADVATVTQGERVPVKFYQGESVERNTFFFMPDGVTPISDLSLYSARMELREYPDDPEPIITLTSEDLDIFLSDTGLIVWEISGFVTKDFEATNFGGDLFVYAPDGDAIMVCGFDFEMTLSHTRGA